MLMAVMVVAVMTMPVMAVVVAMAMAMAMGPGRRNARLAGVLLVQAVRFAVVARHQIELGPGVQSAYLGTAA